MKNVLLTKLTAMKDTISKLRTEIDYNTTHNVTLESGAPEIQAPIQEIDDQATFTARNDLIEKIVAHINKIENEAQMTPETTLNTLMKCEAKADVLFAAIFTLATLDEKHLEKAKTDHPLYNWNRNIFSSFQKTATVVLTDAVEKFMGDYIANQHIVRMRA